MNLGSRRILAIAAAAALALGAAVPAAASPSGPVAGDLAPTSATFYPQMLGENSVLGFAGSHAWTGSFTGTSTMVGSLMQHPSGVATFRGVVTFTGSTPCGPASIRFVTTGSGELPFLTGRAVTIGADDASESVHAQLDVSLVLLPAGAFVHYTGDVHCD
jgi:hypothetical protein